METKDVELTIFHLEQLMNGSLALHSCLVFWSKNDPLDQIFQQTCSYVEVSFTLVQIKNNTLLYKKNKKIIV